MNIAKFDVGSKLLMKKQHPCGGLSMMAAPAAQAVQSAMRKNWGLPCSRSGSERGSWLLEAVDAPAFSAAGDIAADDLIFMDQQCGIVIRSVGMIFDAVDIPLDGLSGVGLEIVSL